MHKASAPHNEVFKSGKSYKQRGYLQALIHNFNSILFIICTCVSTLHLCCMKNALVFSLSEVHSFFVFIIMHLIEVYLTTHNEVFKIGKTYKQRGYLLDSLNEIVFFTVFQHNKSHPHRGTWLWSWCNAWFLMLTENPNALQLLDDDCCWIWNFPVIKVGHINDTLLELNSPNLTAY